MPCEKEKGWQYRAMPAGEQARHSLLPNLWIAPFPNPPSHFFALHFFVSLFYPPAIAPMTKNGSAPLATASGNGASGDSSERSSSQA